MSVYATVDDLTLRLGNVFGAIYRDNTEAAREDLTHAAAEVDAYLGGRYLVPVRSAAARPLLLEWTLALTEEKSYSRAGGASIPVKVKERVELVRRQLRDAANGLLRLPGAEAAGLPGSSGGGATAIPLEIERPVMGRKHMKGY